MGYYSKVTIGLTEALFDELETACKNLNSDLREDVKRTIFDGAEITHSDKIVYMELEEQKWYDDFAAVAWFTSFLEGHPEEDWCMVIIGEEEGDIEWHGDRGKFSIDVISKAVIYV